MKFTLFAAAAALVLTLAACDAGPSAVAKGPPVPPTAAQQTAAASAADPRDAPVPMVNGKPLWAANRKHTAEENAEYQFGKNGKDFAAASEADYVAKAHAFVDTPPAGVQKLQRSNGDALLYDAKTNVFAVVTKEGAPRTMFKPRTGADYWREQQAREAKRQAGGGDDGGSTQG